MKTTQQSIKVKPPTIKNKPGNYVKPNMSNRLQSITAVCPSIQLAVSSPVSLYVCVCVLLDGWMVGWVSGFVCRWMVGLLKLLSWKGFLRFRNWTCL